jgi:hypothetical protein
MISPNIFQFSPQSLLAWTSAYAIWEPISYFIFPAIFKAVTTQEYYNPKIFNFSIVAFGDFIYSTMLFLVAQYVITTYIGSGPASTMTDWWKRVAAFLGIQWVGDLTFYQIIKSVPKSLSNKYIDFFQRYGKDVGIGAPIGDSLYGIVWLLITQFVTSNLAAWIQVFLIATFMFLTLIVSQ